MIQVQPLIQEVLSGKLALSDALKKLRKEETELTGKDVKSLLSAFGVKTTGLPVGKVKKITVCRGDIEVANELGEIEADRGSVSCQPVITAEIKSDGLGISNIKGLEIQEGMIQAEVMEIRFDKERRLYATGGKFMLKLERELPARIPDNIQP